MTTTMTTTTTAATTATATTPARLLHWRQTGALALAVARLLDDIVQGAGVDSASPWEVERHEAQSDEALWAIPRLLAGIAAAQSAVDLAALAAEADETGRARQDDGRGWQAEVWFAASALLWEAAA